MSQGDWNNVTMNVESSAQSCFAYSSKLIKSHAAECIKHKQRGKDNSEMARKWEECTSAVLHTEYIFGVTSVIFPLSNDLN